MKVRIEAHPALLRGFSKSNLAVLLRLFALGCFGVGTWILAAGLKWAGTFPVEHGALSHWQLWMAAGVGSLLAAFRVSREPQP